MCYLHMDRYNKSTMPENAYKYVAKFCNNSKTETPRIITVIASKRDWLDL